MNASLDHLPPRKRADLAKIVALVRDTLPRDEVEMIILYGSYARGDWKEEKDLPPSEIRRSGHASDYDILIVTNSPEAAESVELRTHLDRKVANLPGAGLSAQPRFIAYDTESLNERLADGRFFYTDIKREGRMLYDSGRHTLAEAKALAPPERLRIAQEYYDHWFENAQQFFKVFGFCYNDQDYKRSAFMLHQAAESAYKTILLVFTGESPDEHWLAKLSRLAGHHDPSIAFIIPQETDEEERLFKLLDYAYIGARYDAKYEITKDELDYLSDRVKKLLDRTQTMCTEHLARLKVSE